MTGFCHDRTYPCARLGGKYVHRRDLIHRQTFEGDMEVIAKPHVCVSVYYDQILLQLDLRLCKTWRKICALSRPDSHDKGGIEVMQSFMCAFRCTMTGSCHSRTCPFLRLWEIFSPRPDSHNARHDSKCKARCVRFGVL